MFLSTFFLHKIHLLLSWYWKHLLYINYSYVTEKTFYFYFLFLQPVVYQQGYLDHSDQLDFRTYALQT